MLDPNAVAYVQSLQAAAVSSESLEPEAQLTVPFANFVKHFADSWNIGELSLFREARLDGIRPDFAASINGRPCGWIELKAPDISVDATAWTGKQRRRQWAHLALLDAVIVSNGRNVRLYQEGEHIADASLPHPGATNWDGAALKNLLQLFVATRPTPIRRVSSLAQRLAPLARMLRDRVSDGLTAQTPSEAIRRAKRQWSSHVHEGVTDDQFASDLAQVIAYSLAIAALSGEADANGDHQIDLLEARDALRRSNGVLAAALGPALEVDGLREALDAEIGAIERLVSVVDVDAVHRSKDTRGEPWLWFYEDFLHHYDPEAQRKAGVYYTPLEVVNFQIRSVEHILRTVMGKRLGFGDKSVVALDPATGSGTYPLAILDQAAKTAAAERGPAGPAQVARNLVNNLLAFEILPGPYAVSHLRIGQRLAELSGAFMAPGNVRVYLTDTLDDPERKVPMLELWGDVQVLAEERSRAAQVKSTQPVTVVIGNPPYYRRNSESGGGWVVHANEGYGRALFDDLLDACRRNEVVFSAQASLYNDYVYFWRWAFWKAFEQNTHGPAVVSFITASSWLTGPGFVGLRELARQHADEIWIADLGGSNKAAVKDENIFAIETAVAIVTIYRKGNSKKAPAQVSYIRVTGTSEEKLLKLTNLSVPGAGSTWENIEVSSDLAPWVGATGTDRWEQMVPLVDIFPWQQPGCKFGRAWPIAPDPQTLNRRWKEFLSSDEHDTRAQRFVTGTSGRNIDTQVRGLARLCELPRDAEHRPIVRYGYRSFDKQWTFEDPRLAKTESPSLWRARSDRQIYLASINTKPLGEGPALTVTTEVPDLHFFCNRGGKDIIPLFRDVEAQNPNLPHGLTDLLAELYGEPVTPEDVAAYVYCIMAHPGYYKMFQSELVAPGARVPITSNSSLFCQVRDLGRQLLNLHTNGDRFSDVACPSPVEWSSVRWTAAVTIIPADLEEISYDRDTQTLTVSNGQIMGVRPEVWEYSVSGFMVVQRWLGSRTYKGVGRAANPKLASYLDRIRPQEWSDDWNDELLDLLRSLTATVEIQKVQHDLLTRVMESPLIAPAQLPTPSKAERTVPK